MSPRCPTGIANQTPCPASHHCPLPALLDGAAVHPAPVGIQTPLCPIHLHPINQVLLETFSFKLFLISASPLLFYCTCPSLDFHPLSPRLVRETSNRFTGMQPFLLVFPMPLPVTFLSSWLPGNTHSLGLPCESSPAVTPFLTQTPTPGIRFFVSLIILCLTVLTYEMG